MRRDVLVTLAGALGGAGAALLWGGGTTANAVGMVAIGAALGVSRHSPRLALTLVVAAVLAVQLADHDAEQELDLYVLVAAHAFLAGRWDGGRAPGLAIAVFLVAIEVLAATATSALVPALFVVLTAWLAGRALREREDIVAELAERARELEDEREAYASLSVRYERARIASELHDIVAHALSVMVVQATAGQRLAGRDPEATAEVLDAIAGAAREAEADMGRLVTLLGDEEAIGPAPDLVLVEELVARAAGSGLDVTLRLEGDRQGLPAPVVHAAYRVVQEGLTNALRYASGAPVTVRVRGDRDELVVEVVNGPAGGDAALAGTGTGNGLRGLRERVGACGGTLSAGPVAGGGWSLSARLDSGRGSSRTAAGGAGRPSGSTSTAR
jgi:signal transduction histidine kinase